MTFCGIIVSMRLYNLSENRRNMFALGVVSAVALIGTMSLLFSSIDHIVSESYGIGEVDSRKDLGNFNNESVLNDEIIIPITQFDGSVLAIVLGSERSRD